MSPIAWRKSSYSASQSNCVEVACGAAASAIRDTKHRDLATLAFPSPEWSAFIEAVKTGDWPSRPARRRE
ncbi:DUF397 domain-containing protein [Nocardiopsis sediminis]|uniref:DUF397 domain-containing protein n=1 Tax=Nocardiopsis sediminis TaxID=1778267 RepID=A0ABV8FJL7_9ACTN